MIWARMLAYITGTSITPHNTCKVQSPLFMIASRMVKNLKCIEKAWFPVS
jgi:hypothetical protein